MGVMSASRNTRIFRIYGSPDGTDIGMFRVAKLPCSLISYGRKRRDIAVVVCVLSARCRLLCVVGRTLESRKSHPNSLPPPPPTPRLCGAGSQLFRRPRQVTRQTGGGGLRFGAFLKCRNMESTKAKQLQ